MGIFIRVEFLIAYTAVLLAVAYIAGRVHGKNKHKPVKNLHPRKKR